LGDEHDFDDIARCRGGSDKDSDLVRGPGNNGSANCDGNGSPARGLGNGSAGFDQCGSATIEEADVIVKIVASRGYVDFSIENADRPSDNRHWSYGDSVGIEFDDERSARIEVASIIVEEGAVTAIVFGWVVCHRFIW
tara:strand:+ start:5951 stop:6364 length:414 start_codon:yes stop_codon:yes gene_type:complete